MEALISEADLRWMSALGSVADIGRGLVFDPLSARKGHRGHLCRLAFLDAVLWVSNLEGRCTGNRTRVRIPYFAEMLNIVGQLRPTLAISLIWNHQVGWIDNAQLQFVLPRLSGQSDLQTEALRLSCRSSHPKNTMIAG